MGRQSSLGRWKYGKEKEQGYVLTEEDEEEEEIMWSKDVLGDGNSKESKFNHLLHDKPAVWDTWMAGTPPDLY